MCDKHFSLFLHKKTKSILNTQQSFFMKRIYFALFLFAFSFTINAQVQNLYAMSKGNLVYSKIIYDDNNSLWGYFYLYKLDSFGDSNKMEYIVLDKNLNNLTSGTYHVVEYNPLGASYYFKNYENCHLVGDKLLLDMTMYRSSSSGLTHVHNSHLIISLKLNTVSNEYLFIDNQFDLVPHKPIKRSNRLDSLRNKTLIDPVYGSGKSGLLLRSWNMTNNVNERNVRFYSLDREFMWEYTFDNQARKMKSTMNKTYNTIDYLFMDSVNIYFKERTIDNGKYKSSKLIGLDLNTGKKTLDYPIDSVNSETYHQSYMKQIGDTIAIFGRYFDNPELKKSKYYKGYYRILLDKNGIEINRKYQTWKDISNDKISITEESKINNTRSSFVLSSVFMFNDGSFSFVGQEYKRRSDALAALYGLSLGILNFDKAYSKDLFFFNFDKNFEFSNSERIEMNKVYKDNNMLFTQYHYNNMAAIVCHSNKKGKEHNNEYELVINTIKNNTLHTERIPITSKKNYVIIPRPAKDGYIMLNEYNTNEKYNQIRLEKLNY